jgi:hypothetical protein
MRRSIGNSSTVAGPRSQRRSSERRGNACSLPHGQTRRIPGEAWSDRIRIGDARRRRFLAAYDEEAGQKKKRRGVPPLLEPPLLEPTLLEPALWESTLRELALREPTLRDNDAID